VTDSAKSSFIFKRCAPFFKLRGTTMSAAGRSASSGVPGFHVPGSVAAAAHASPSSLSHHKPQGPVNATRQQLKQYYQHLFPVQDLCAWLSYTGNVPSSSNSSNSSNSASSSSSTRKPSLMFQKREFSFTMADGKYWRYQSFKSAFALRASMVRHVPSKIDIGACYNVSPKPVKFRDESEAFVAVERELVFDIDLTDYDSVRTSSSGTGISKKCWGFVAVAVKVLDARLRSDFGFKHLFWVYSGRRGVHCWVCDKRARLLSNKLRAAIANYLSYVQPEAKLSAKRGEKQGEDDETSVYEAPLHPALEQSMPCLRAFFERSVIQSQGQALLSDKANWSRILDLVPDFDFVVCNKESSSKTQDSLQNPPYSKRMKPKSQSFVAHLTDLWTHECSNASERWACFKKQVNILKHNGSLHKSTRRLLSSLETFIVTTCTYPRLDVNVTTHMTHLLKAPFCIHPSTGNVCVPLSVAAIDDFDPTKDVPTLAQLLKEVSDFDAAAKQTAATSKPPKTTTVDKTSLKKFLDMWKAEFLQPLLSSGCN
jgi:DNA primase small subunit